MKVFISPREKDYVFEAFGKSDVEYEKKEFTIWVCDACDKIHTEKPSVCSCSDSSFTGDFVSMGDIVGENMNYIIERKKGADLLHSFQNDRLYLQLQTMKEVFSGNVALVLEGSFEEIEKEERKRVKTLARNMRVNNRYGEATRIMKSIEARISQMYSIPAHCMSLGISFIHVDNIESLIRMLKYMDYKCGEEPKIREKKSPMSKIQPSLVKKLTTTDGISDTIAYRIFSKIEEPKTPEVFVDFLRFNPRKLLEVEGVGKKKLENLEKDWL